MASFPITPYAGGPIENTEFNFRGLYLHHISGGPNKNQILRVPTDATLRWGDMAVNSWEVYDGSGPDAKIVGHARGLHLNAVKWHVSFTLEFEDGRYLHAYIFLFFIICLSVTFLFQISCITFL
jgi:hypothetical protein